MNKLEEIKKEKSELERFLLSKNGNMAAIDICQVLQPYFEKVNKMEIYYPIGSLRLSRLFLEINLSDDDELFSCYERFANLVEGVEV